MIDNFISTIVIPSDKYSSITEEGKTETLQGLSRINIFLGPNNSGKSRFIREILKNKFYYLPTFFNQIEWNRIIDKILKEIEPYFDSIPNSKIMDVGGIFSNVENFKNLYFQCNNKKVESLLQALDGSIESVSGNTNTNSDRVNLSKVGRRTKLVIEKNIDQHPLYNRENLISLDYIKIYIPILRGLIPICSFISEKKDFSDIYQEYINNVYFKDSNDEVIIFSGLTAFKLVKEHLLGNRQQRKLVRDFETYLSTNFFDNEIVEIIPNEESNFLVLKIGDECEQPISNLGDGIQSIINITLPMFLYKDQNVLFFIEEPEKYLHPGMQRKLIEMFFHPEFLKYQYFITTHSNHFLSITIEYEDISIFSIKKEYNDDDLEDKLPIFSISLLSNNDHSILELLGVHNSSVLLANCTIWVEGITDRLYLRKFLSIYQDSIKPIEAGPQMNTKKFDEDYHYSFVEYAGSNITHWSFLENEDPTINVEQLCGKIFLIADKDSRKEKRHQELKEKLGDRFYLLECREIENILKPEVINSVLSEYEKEDIEVFKDINEYKNDFLARKIDEKIPVSKRPRQPTYADKYGSLKIKVPFCHRALKYIKTWEDISEEGQDLTKKIYDFIKSNNS